MITKAIVEELINPYSARIRIPILDRAPQSSVHTSTEHLSVAIINTQPGCKPNLKPGDVVFVSKDDVEDDPVIIGQLYSSKHSDSYSDFILNHLIVNSEASLPSATSIGYVNAQEISALSGINENIQKQINSLREQIVDIWKHLNSIKDSGS